MTIERDAQIQFHELGTLHSVTRWIRDHEVGLAEWLKNVRRAYQSDRANVDEPYRVAVLLLKDADASSPARIALLDVGGATLEDVSALNVWQDPNASSRGSQVQEETTQGNGGKAYMYRMFRGLTRLLGVNDRRRNCKGFDGPADSLERGILGFIPSNAAGRDVPGCDWEHELRLALQPYDVRPNELPPIVQQALQQRQSLTLVEGVDPIDLHRGRIDADTLIERLLFHDQAVLAVQQLQVFAFHNGRIMRGGHRLELAPIRPYPGFETERVIPIPETLPNEDGQPLSTTRDGTRPAGRLILRTSAQDMPRAFFKLRARWKMSYRTDRQMIGSKSISELAPNCPGSYFVYGEVELAALTDYVELGRVRPAAGPLVIALDHFIGEQIRELAREISDRRRQDQDQGELDEVREENRLLDQFKNRFLNSAGLGGFGGEGTQGQGPRPPGPTPGYKFGVEPRSIEFQRPVEVLRIARGVKLFPTAFLEPRVKDDEGLTVRAGPIEWVSGDRHVVEFVGPELIATGKGETEIWVRLQGSDLESMRIRVVVLNIDHILLTPRNLEIPQGTRQQIQAEVTDDDGHRSTDVYLEWAHDSDDPLLVRVSPKGSVFGNRVGSTSVRAGAGDPTAGGAWARIPVDVKVVPNERPNIHGGGFPELRVTDRDLDPETGQRRESDPDRPSLFQDVVDYEYNIWWLNLAAPDAAFFFQQRTANPILWRAFHAQKLVEMVGQVRMKEQLTGDGREERPEVWARHKGMSEDFQVELMAQMWQQLQPYILTGQGLE